MKAQRFKPQSFRMARACRIAICLVILWDQSASLLLKAETSDTTNGEPQHHQTNHHKESHHKAKAKKIEASDAKSLGLDPITLKMVNKGQFAQVIERLKGRTQDLSAPNRQSAWLAFSYLYLGQCDPLKDLAGSFKDSTSDDLDEALIQAFDLICQKKTTEAEQKLQQISAASMHDAFVNYTFATVAGKQGKAAIAVAYLQRATELAPQFAWGFRTLGFLQQKSLHAPTEAEASYLKALQIEPNLTEALDAVVDLKLAHNDFDGAIAVAQSALEIAPASAATHYLLAQIYMRQWRFLDGAIQLQRAITLEPDNAKYYRSRAALLRYQGKLAEAIADQQKVVELDTDKELDLIDLASMEVLNGQEAASIEHLKQVLSINPTNKRANDQLVKLLASQGKFQELVTELKLLVEKNPKEAVLRLRLADALVSTGKAEAAIEEYKQAANLNPSDPEPHRKIAAIYIVQRNFKLAAASYTRALNINSNSVPDLVSLGLCYGQTDDYLQAEAALVTALALHQLTQVADSQLPPTRLDIIRSLATLLFKEGRYADSAAQFVTVGALDKGMPTEVMDAFMSAQANALRDRSNAAFTALKVAFEKLSPAEQAQQKINYVDTLIRDKRYDEAASLLSHKEDVAVPQSAASAKDIKDAAKELKDAKDIEKAEIEKEHPFQNICWSRIWLGKGDLAKAEEAAQKAVSTKTTTGEPPSDALCQLGEVFLEKENLSAAGQNAQRALEINAKSFRAFDLLGRIALKKGDPKLAIEAANKALEIDPYYAQAYLLLGDAQMAGKDFNGASASFHKAVDLYPGLLDAHESLLVVLGKLSSPEELKREEATIRQLKSLQ